MNKFDEIHEFWFENVDDTVIIKKDQNPFKKWFTKDPGFDEEIRRRYEEEILAADAGKREDWKDALRGQMALILLFDQFTRNIYRNTPRMFAFDEKALAIARENVESGMLEELMLIERVFLYLPFEHAEDPAMQEICVEGNRALVEESRKVNPKNTTYFEYTLDYAHRHQEIIKRFGRFPHRNRILGRASTPEEEEFLKQPNSGF